MDSWLEFASGSDVGSVRSNNEDYADFREPKEPALAEKRGTLFAVADGMGGMAAGEVASRLAVETLMERYYGDTAAAPLQAFTDAFREANSSILERAARNPQEASMGTTLTAFAIFGGRGVYAHIGDSRLYLLRRGKLQVVTSDHTLAQEQLRRGDISEEEAARSHNRSLLTRALGLQADIEVETGSIDVEPGDVFLLCTDGLYHVLGGERIREILERSEPRTACQRFIDEVKEKSGDDNITAQVIAVKGAPAAGGEPLPQPGIIPAVLVSVLLLFLLGRLLATTGMQPTRTERVSNGGSVRPVAAGFECVDFALGKSVIYMLGLDRGGTRIVSASLDSGKAVNFWERPKEFTARPNGMAIVPRDAAEDLYFIALGHSLYRNTGQVPGVTLKDGTCLAFDNTRTVMYIAEGKREGALRSFSVSADGLKEREKIDARFRGPVRKIVCAGDFLYLLDDVGIQKATPGDMEFSLVVKGGGISDFDVDDFGRMYIVTLPSRVLKVLREGEDPLQATQVNLEVLPIKILLDGRRNLWCLEKSKRGIVHPQNIGWISN